VSRHCGKNGYLDARHTKGQFEIFPSPDGVRTSYVEHDIDGSEEYTSVLRFILSDKRILAAERER
jgi:elongation factor 3